jgi:hypothetical protein
MKTSKLAATFVAAALAASAGIANAAAFGDENDASWIYTPPTAKKWGSEAAPAPQQTARFGDENDASWIYAAPAQVAKPVSAPSAHERTVSSGVLDENGTTSSYTQLN